MSSRPMESIPVDKAFTFLESGPVVLVTTHDGQKHNIMTISWTMVLDFTPAFAIATGPWNHSFNALRKTRECVISIPTADMLDEVVGIGMCSGVDTDKFEKFGLTAAAAGTVSAPLIKECLANIECRVSEFIDRHNIIVLDGVAAWYDSRRKYKRTLHAVGDGTFIDDGRRRSRRRMMREKIYPGVL